MRTQALPSADANPTRSTPFVFYLIAFHAAWAAWPYVFYPRVVAIGDRTLAYALVNLAIRVLVWIVPVFAYLKYVDGVDPIRYLRLRERIGRGVAVGLALTVLNFLGSLLRFGVPHPTMQAVTWNSLLGSSFLIGFIEEIPYRGFMLQKIEARTGFWAANLITSLLFLEVHLPGWMALHMLTAPRALSVFVFGAIMAVVFRYARTLWAPILAHSGNDFLSVVVFRA